MSAYSSNTFSGGCEASPFSVMCSLNPLIMPPFESRGSFHVTLMVVGLYDTSVNGCGGAGSPVKVSNVADVMQFIIRLSSKRENESR